MKNIKSSLGEISGGIVPQPDGLNFTTPVKLSVKGDAIGTSGLIFSGKNIHPIMKLVTDAALLSSPRSNDLLEQLQQAVTFELETTNTVTIGENASLGTYVVESKAKLMILRLSEKGVVGGDGQGTYKSFEIPTLKDSETINSLFDSPPTLKEAAYAIGSSHQNVKQMALKLQQKGLLTLEKDKKDARVTRLNMTEQSYEFWKQTDPKGALFRERMFKEMDSNDIARTRHLLEKLLSNLDEIENAVTDNENT